jgi:hypothetical protein
MSGNLQNRIQKLEQKILADKEKLRQEVQKLETKKRRDRSHRLIKVGAITENLLGVEGIENARPKLIALIGEIKRLKLQNGENPEDYLKGFLGENYEEQMNKIIIEEEADHND